MKNTKNDDNGIICFDEEYFFNKKGIESLGLSETDSKAIHNYLITQHRMGDGSKGLVFYNSVVHLRDFERVFIKKGIIEKKPFEWSDVFDYLRIFRVIFSGGHIYRQIKLIGFFKIEKPFLNNRNWFSRLKYSHKAYANRVPIEEKLPIQVHIDNLISDNNNAYYLPKNLSDENFSDRINTEYYFSNKDLTSACYFHFPNFDVNSIDIPLCKVYENGELVESNNVALTNETSLKESPMKIASRERIIAALILILKNPNSPKFEKKSHIYRHLEKHFKGIEGLNERYISEFISNATSDLKKREKDNGYNTTYIERVSPDD